MTDPVNKQFFNEVELRCANITEANGYNFDVNKIDRARLVPFKGYDIPAINIWSTNVANERPNYDSDQRDLYLFIEVHHKTMDLPFVDVCDMLAQDLVIALNRAVSAPLVSDDEDPDLGGICDDLIFLGYDYQVGQDKEPFCAILAEFIVRYTVNQNNM